MSLALLLPLGLAALAAWVLPLLIHLARRSEQRPTEFAALRWLRQRPKPRHRIRFDDWPLLLLRLLLLALLALWLARPVLSGADSARAWVAVAPGADLAAARAAAAAQGAGLHWLIPGFPAVAEEAVVPPADAGTAATASLLRELDARLPAQAALQVFVPERLGGLDAERLRLSRRIGWHATAGASPSPPMVALAAVAPPALRHAPERASALPYLRAALMAWSATAPADARADVAPLSASWPQASNGLIWLAPGAVPATVLARAREGATVLLDAQADWPADAAPEPAALWRDAAGAVLAQGGHYGRGRLLRLTRPLSPAQWPELLEPGFVAGLRGLFQPSSPPPTRARAGDVVPRTGAVAAVLPPQDLGPWLAVAIALVALLERWRATRARSGGGP
ncbi:BatA domain-containing protein [Lysobacter sp. BMK333-48F3]|uniref:BatA domain-containing protein n=1 Tax=Lysobacter sp. BMK333-48F3 TaxID=2867962 RepID=UPI001C8BBE12|nr:BatA domain-containing protein [Lysobacter sp. BMK333-48F3]